MTDVPRRFTIAEHVAWELVDDGSVMFCHLPSGEFGQMPAPGGVIWERLADGLTLDELAALVAEPHALPPELATAGAQEIYDTLAERDLVANAPE